MPSLMVEIPEHLETDGVAEQPSKRFVVVADHYETELSGGEVGGRGMRAHARTERLSIAGHSVGQPRIDLLRF